MPTTATKKSAPAKSAAKKASSNGRGKVKAKSTAAEGLRELFIDELKDIYWAEKALTKALPKMAKNATDENLKTAILEHLEVTKGQVQRVEEVFLILDEKAVAKKCEAMAGLVKEGEEIMESTEPGPVRDAGIISAGQKVEHYEIASYGTLAAFARILGEDDAAELLEATLAEEKDADQTLTDCAENAVNIEASDEDDEEED
jgi:ferritin-like metal-binding protein YciE